VTARGRPAVPVTIALADDFAVYARLCLRYQEERTQDVLALCVLAQRVVVEKAKQYYKRRGRMDEIAKTIDRINNDDDFARSLVYLQDRNCRLGQVYPHYVASGLLG